VGAKQIKFIANDKINDNVYQSVKGTFETGFDVAYLQN